MRLDEAARLLAGGGVGIYPTETLYALGCAASQAGACARVAALKGRPQSKPFPLIVADFGGLERILGRLPAPLEPDLEALAARFWPGPLSVLLPTRPDLPALVRDPDGFSSVRISPHPVARGLCRLVQDLGGAGLVATSANTSGRPAAATPARLDPVLAREADLTLLDRPWPAGGPPSTLIRLLGEGRAAVLRLGAVPAEDLAQVFSLEPAGSPGQSS